jgi:hypothetical protein
MANYNKRSGAIFRICTGKRRVFFEVSLMQSSKSGNRSVDPENPQTLYPKSLK